MGAHLVRKYLGYPEPDFDKIPASPQGPQFEERVMVATQEQMNMAKVPIAQRDYCAHYYIKFMKCRRDMWPKLWACDGDRHDWEYCQHEDYVQRMKQYERERRLLVRKALKEQQEAA